MVGVVVTLAIALLLLILLLSPVLGVVLGIVRMSRVRRFRASAARLQGTVKESPIAARSSGGVMPNGAGGVTYVGGGTRIASRPVVVYPGPDGTPLTNQVRYAAPQIYVYGQPVDLLVDPRDPRDVRLVAADGAAAARRVLTTSIALAVAWVVIIVVLVVVANLIS